MNKSEELIEFVEDRPGHDFRYSMSSEKISRELKWNTKTKFDEGLENTIKWYLDNTDYWKDISTDTLNSTPWKN